MEINMTGTSAVGPTWTPPTAVAHPIPGAAPWSRPSAGAPAQPAVQRERGIAYTVTTLLGRTLSAAGTKKRFVTDPLRGVPPRSRPA
ncbi:hypothetical protein GCM10010123_33460 [Pilimelia anulata]|uniref:Uncharacterized protein n=1 Tax=Pilimelia anulata TaxID=53371 RepID=A0A8J3B8D6_9ACTN|nr:hypothetical protein [Pilimelia anulata]GGK00852.1 hypothetical protein GCM10010123_33460 [Pilimelia anulata]